MTHSSANDHLNSAIQSLRYSPGSLHQQIRFTVRSHKQTGRLHTLSAENRGHAFRTPQPQLVIRGWIAGSIGVAGNTDVCRTPFPYGKKDWGDLRLGLSIENVLRDIEVEREAYLGTGYRIERRPEQAPYRRWVDGVGCRGSNRGARHLHRLTRLADLLLAG